MSRTATTRPTYVPALPASVTPIHRTYQVAGKVLTDTTTPCPNADVSLTDHAELRATYEPDGTVRFDGVPPGRYAIDVSCKNYRSAPRYDAVVVTDRDELGLSWFVTPGASISGRVRSSLGEPVADAHVSVAMIGVDTPLQRSGWGRDQSDANGRFRISGLPPGIYYVAIDSTLGLTPIGAFRVVVDDDEAVERDFMLDAAALVDGVLEDNLGRSIPQTDVYARAVGTKWSQIATTDETGRFHLTARAGEITLVAQRPGQTYFVSTDPVDARITVNAGGNRVKLIIASP